MHAAAIRDRATGKPPHRPKAAGAQPVQRLATGTPGPIAAGSVPLGPVQRSNLPSLLRTGMEQLSGIGLADVQVYRNSFKPARLQAHAFAQGNEIHLGPGQDRHLPHELAHIVQQRQGRVPVTGRIGATPLNDDTRLEAEADAMGRAAQVGHGRAPAPVSRGDAIAGPTQRATAPIQRIEARTHDDRLWQRNPFVFGKANNWIDLADRLEREIVSVAENIEDYTDGTAKDIKEHREFLADLEEEFDEQIRKGNRIMRRIDKQKQTFLGSDDDFLEVYQAIRELYADFQDKFLPAGGGFSASARSTLVDNVTIKPTKATHNAPFLRNVRIGARTFEKYQVTKPLIQPDPGKVVLRLGSTYHDDDDYKVGDTLPGYDHSNFFMHPIASNQQEAKNFYPRKRETTQDGAMGGVSARTYAWMSNTAGWNTQKWEWLHLRAASLGGATNAQNLVLGTRDANTHMMPFESNLVLTAKKLAGTPRYQGITVDWSFSGQDPTWKYKVRKITIKWIVHLVGHDDQIGGEVTFYPLEDKAVLSRAETNFIEQALHDERETLHGHASKDLPPGYKPPKKKVVKRRRKK